MKAALLHTLFLAFLCFALPAQALKSDRDQPADIQADDIEFDFQKGTRTYLNNVLAVQGTLRLKADKLIAVYEGSELAKATMWGSLARFKQRPDGKPYDAEGWAKKIVVDQKQNTLTLIGQAALKQGPDTARGHTIVYNMANDTLKVKGGAAVGSGGNTNKARPKKKLADPFADDKGPPEAPTSATGATRQANSESTSDGTAAIVEPAKRGRSRLIIRPKQVVESDDAEEEEKEDSADKAKQDSNTSGAEE